MGSGWRLEPPGGHVVLRYCRCKIGHEVSVCSGRLFRTKQGTILRPRGVGDGGRWSRTTGSGYPAPISRQRISASPRGVRAGARRSNISGSASPISRYEMRVRAGARRSDVSGGPTPIGRYGVSVRQ